jgi:3-phenylpropionate/trans-cinnamate dioxygenase ferredoxin subunit
VGNVTELHLADSPDEGAMATGEAGGVRITVANVGGELYAFEDTCTHEDCSLSEEGYLTGMSVVCGCHGAEFDLRSGEPVDGPAHVPLRTFAVTRAGAGAVVSLGAAGT